MTASSHPDDYCFDKVPVRSAVYPGTHSKTHSERHTFRDLNVFSDWKSMVVSKKQFGTLIYARQRH